MKNKSAKNRTAGAGQSIGPEIEDAILPEDGADLPGTKAAPAGRKPALALSMGLPGTRLDMTLGGPHPLLVQLVRAMARAAAQADHAVELAYSTDRPTPETQD